MHKVAKSRFSEGEDLQVNFGPSWTRTPKLDVLVGNGTLKTNSVMLLTRESSGANRIGSTISLLHWGVKMVITKVMDPVHLIGYQLVLTRVQKSAEGRALRITTISSCDKDGKERENGAASVHGFLLLLDRVILGNAKERVENSAKNSRAIVWQGWPWFAL